MNLSTAVVVLALLISLPAATNAEPPTIVTTTVQRATCGVPYVAKLFASGGNEATRRWIIHEDELPRGLVVDPGACSVYCRISGTPMETGSFPFVGRVEDGEGEFDEASFVLEVVRAHGPVCPAGSGGSGGSSAEGGSGGMAGSMGAGAGGGGAGGNPDTGTGADSFRHVNHAPSGGCDCGAARGGLGAIALLAHARRRRR